ncbi:MAG TPA: hypothetical protein VF474_16205 [Phenylobacterium sp.]
MLAGLRQILGSSVTGMIAIAVAITLAVLLGIMSANWQAERAHYEMRISELGRAAEKAQAGLRMELTSCQAAGAARKVTSEAEFAARGTTAGARRLLEQQPEGIDACARMESADEAVLSNLQP